MTHGIFFLLITLSVKGLTACSKEESTNGSESIIAETKPEKTVELPNNIGEMSARPIEYGNWLFYIRDDDARLEEAFNQYGLLTCQPEFELFVKYLIDQFNPDEYIHGSILGFELDCHGEYEIRLKEDRFVIALFKTFDQLYQSNSSLVSETENFKKEVKVCLNSYQAKDSFLCNELKNNPLPKPKPRYIISESGETKPLSGFSECYDKIIKSYKRDITKKESSEAEKGCYSSW
jgi:hypothetical protein